MNEIIARIKNIQCVNDLTIVELDYYSLTLTMMSLSLCNMKEGMKVILSINSSHIGFSKDKIEDISFSNILDSKVVEIDEGKLVTCIKLKIHDTYLNTIITTKSLKKMNININDKVFALIKASDISIKEVL